MQGVEVEKQRLERAHLMYSKGSQALGSSEAVSNPQQAREVNKESVMGGNVGLSHLVHCPSLERLQFALIKKEGSQ